MDIGKQQRVIVVTPIEEKQDGQQGPTDIAVDHLTVADIVASNEQRSGEHDRSA
jgi:hypothetical protein